MRFYVHAADSAISQDLSCIVHYAYSRAVHSGLQFYEQ